MTNENHHDYTKPPFGELDGTSRLATAKPLSDEPLTPRPYREEEQGGEYPHGAMPDNSEPNTAISDELNRLRGLIDARDVQIEELSEQLSDWKGRAEASPCKCADYEKAAGHNALCEYGKALAERDELKTELDAIKYAAHMPGDYSYNLATYINTVLYACYIGAKISPDVQRMVENGSLVFPDAPIWKRAEAADKERDELKAALAEQHDAYAATEADNYAYLQELKLRAGARVGELEAAVNAEREACVEWVRTHHGDDWLPRALLQAREQPDSDGQL